MSRCAMVHGASHQLLAGAGFAGNQHRAAASRHQLDSSNHLADGVAATDDAVPLKVRAGHRRRGRSDMTISRKLHKHSSLVVRADVNGRVLIERSQLHRRLRMV